MKFEKSEDQEEEEKADSETEENLRKADENKSLNQSQGGDDIDIEETKSEEDEASPEREGPFRPSFAKTHTSMKLKQDGQLTKKVRSSGMSMTTSLA